MKAHNDCSAVLQEHSGPRPPTSCSPIYPYDGIRVCQDLTDTGPQGLHLLGQSFLVQDGANMGWAAIWGK